MAWFNRYVFGSFYSDTIFANNLSNYIFSFNGDDTVYAQGGNDWVFAGSGNDYVDGGSGNDVLFGGNGQDTLIGGTGHDDLYGGFGNDILDGGDGNDYLYGSFGDDIITGGAGRDRLYGDSGNDDLDGGAGNDRLYGGSGDDDMDGGSGSDRLYGGSGNDDMDGGSGNDRLYAGSGSDVVFGAAGDDRLYAGSGDDTLDGGQGRDLVYGQSGNDTLILTTADETGDYNYYDGGSGVDTLVLNLTAEEFASQVTADDLDAYLAYADSGSNGRFTFSTINLRINAIETLQVFVDGVQVNPQDAGPGNGGGEDPVANDDAFDVAEGDTLEGDVTSNDTADTGTTITLISTVSEGTLVLNNDGTFTFEAGDDFDALAPGEEAQVSFTYELSLNGVSSQATATITVTGTNDAPMVSAPLTASVNEGNIVSVDLLDGASDIDGGELSVDLSDTILPAGVVFDGTNLLLDANDPAYNSLAAGQEVEFVINYDVTDGQGGSIPQSVTLTVVGTNDAPTVAAALTAAANEDSASFTLDLLSGASDVDSGTTLSVTNVMGLVPATALNGSVLTIDPSDSNLQILAAGETLEVAVSYDVIDGDGGVVPQTATVTFTGTNDTPTVAAALTASGTEGSEGFFVNMLDGATDIDNLAELSVDLDSVTGLRDGVTLNGFSVVVDPADPSFDGLVEGEVLDVVVSYNIVDQFGASVPQTITVTITGTSDNSAPTVTGALTSSLTEGGTAQIIDLLEGAEDVDGDELSAVLIDVELPAGAVLIGNAIAFDPSDPAYDALGAGQQVSFILPYSISDDSGASVSQTLTITVVGTNDAPTVSAALTDQAEEGESDFALDLLVGANDVEGDVLSVQLGDAPLPAGVTVDGRILTFDPTDATYDSLAAGQNVDVVVNYLIIDEAGDSVAQTVTITVNGTNDAPVISAAVTGAATEGGESVELDLLAGARDVDNGAALSVTSVDELLPAGVSIDGSTLTFDPTDAAYDSLAVGETVDLVVNYLVTDGEGATVPQSATLTVTGTNDAPVVSNEIFWGVAENGESSTVIDLLQFASDLDAGDVLEVAFDAALPGFLTLDGTNLIVDTNDPQFEELSVSDSLQFALGFTVSDGNGGAVPQTLNLTVLGSNDAPVVTGTISEALSEDDADVTINLLSNVTDVDANDTLSVVNATLSSVVLSTVSQGYPADSLIINDDGTVSVNPGLLDQLGTGETATFTVDYIVTDGFVDLPQTATITVTGTNDAPTVAAALSAPATEGGAEVRIFLLEGASDLDDGAVLSIRGADEVLPEGVTIENGDLVFNPNDPAYDSLAEGEELQIVVNYFVLDETGASVAQSATIELTGTNDTPAVAMSVDAAANEGGESVSLDLLEGASDVDNDAVLSITSVDEVLPAGVSIDGTTLTFDPSDAAYDNLAEGDLLDVVVNYAVTDELGASIPQTATITITGTNDAPFVSGALSGAATEGGEGVTLDLLAGARDVDNGAVLSVTGLEGVLLPAGVSIEDSTLTFDPTDVAYDSLAAGEELDLVVNYLVSDETGATVPQSATITITGTNDAPFVSTALSGAANEGGESITLDLLAGARDVDNDAVLSVRGLADVILPAGISIYRGTLTFDPTNAAYDSLAAGEELDLVVNYLVSDEAGATVPQTATITITGTNDAPVVAAALTGAATEGGASVTLDLLEGASDVDATDTLFVQFGDAPLPEGVSVDGSTLTFDPTDPAYDSLSVGVEQLITIEYQVVDSEGAAIDQTATLTVTGTNDVPEVESALSVNIIEGRLAFAFRALTGASDVDADDTLTVANVDPLPTGIQFSTSFGGQFILDPGSSAFNDLAVDDTREFVINFDIVDGNGGVVPQSLTVTVTGTNDAPRVESILTATLTEDDGAQTFDLLEGASDPDQGAVLSVVLGDTPLPTGVSLDGTTLTVNPRSTNEYQNLAAGDSLEFVINYTVEDQFGASDAQSFVLTITGTNDRPNLQFLTPDQVTEIDVPFSLTIGDNPFIDVDDGDSLTYSSTLSDGSDLPEWLSFDAETLTFSGTPGALETGVYTVRLIATDEAGLSSFDTFRISVGADFIIGTESGETLNGTNANETLIGLGGDDLLQGGRGQDIYVFNVGDGVDTINDAGLIGTADTAEFRGRDLSEATFTRDGNAVIIGFDNGDSVRVEDTLNGGGRVIESYVFADQTIDIATVRDIILQASQTDGDDNIQGYNFDETLEGGRGDDSLSGGRGTDTYVFNSGDGSDVITDSGLTGVADTLWFTDYNLTDATFTRDSYNTVTISFTNGDSVTINSTLNGGGSEIETFEFLDGPITISDVRDILLAQSQTNGDDDVIGFNYDDTIEGGEGNDALSGGRGQDRYIFTSGDGQDVITESGFSGQADILEFTDYALVDATFTRDSYTTFTVSFANGDSVTINSTLSGGGSEVETLQFTDGPIDMNDVRDILLAGSQTNGDDTVQGYIYNDTLEGGEGNDTLSGGRGEDRYIFNIGDGEDIITDSGFSGQADVLEFTGYNLSDATFTRVDFNSFTMSFANGDSVTINSTLNGGGSVIETIQFLDGPIDMAAVRDILIDVSETDGDDTITGFNYDETLEGGLGNDALFGGRGEDTYVFNEGDGIDTIEDRGYSGEDDTLNFVDYDLAEAAFSRDGNSLVISFINGDQVRVEDINFTSRRIENYQFADQAEPIALSTILDIIAAYDGTEGDDVITGSFIDDDLSGQDGADTLTGGLGNDTLSGDAGEDVLNGGEGDDLLNGGADNDTLEGGAGMDINRGGEGNDTYLFNAGDGIDLVDDIAGEADVLSFVNYDLIEASFSQFADSFVISFDNGDEVTVFNATAFAGGSIESYQFADQTLTTADVQAIIDSQAPVGELIVGDGEDNVLTGTDGDDTLIGGLGDDDLNGGNGSDLYQYTLGDGNDFYGDTGTGLEDVDTLEIFGVNFAEVFLLSEVETGDILMLMPDGGSITIPNNFFGPPGIEQFVFVNDPANPEDDQIFSFYDLLELSGGGGPIVVGPPPSQEELVIAENTVDDFGSMPIDLQAFDALV